LGDSGEELHKGRVVACASEVHRLFKAVNEGSIAKRVEQSPDRSLDAVQLRAADFGVGVDLTAPVILDIIPSLKWRLMRFFGVFDEEVY